ncbi:hypothetical protein ACFWAV_35335, partial [Rhodococcus jostii]
LSKSHAMATFVGYDTPVRCGTASYTIFMDATTSCTPNGHPRNNTDPAVQLATYIAARRPGLG